MRARPCGVAWAAATAVCQSSPARFTSAGTLTIGNDDDGASSVFSVNIMSSRVFQNDRLPASAPHCGMAATNRSGYFWATPAATSAPSELPR